MLRKGAIVVSDPKEDQFLSSLFLVKKKDGGKNAYFAIPVSVQSRKYVIF